MPISIREQILDAITTAVSGEYGVPAPETERDLPVCIVQDAEEESIPTQYGADEITMVVAVAKAEAATVTDKGAMRAQAHELLASIRADMFVDETFGNLVDGIEYVGGGIQTELAKICFCEAQFSIRYTTVRGDPYSQP